MHPDAQDDHARDVRRPSPDPAEAVAAELRAAAEELDGLAERPLDDHVAVYERLHARMHEALRSVEQ